MTDKDSTSAGRETPAAPALRSAAEAMLREQTAATAKSLAAPSSEAAGHTLHELRVHQIELEMQNDELQRTQTELAAARARYFDLYDLAPVGYCVLGETGLILQANLTAGTLLGVARSALLKQPISRFIFSEDQDIFYRLRREISTSGGAQTTELRMTGGDAGLLWVQLTANAATDENGAPLLRITLSDITGRKQSETMLGQFKAIIDGNDDAIISMTLAGVIESWNAGAERLFGYMATEAIGNTMQIVIAADRWNEEAMLLKQLSGGARIDNFETVRRHKDGHSIDVSVTISPILDGDGNVTGASKVARNISDRKQAEFARDAFETQLRESQKMEAIGTLAGGIAHDFNNIIAAILGNTELASQDAVANPVAMESLDEIRKAAKRARDLVRQILSYSRRQPTELKALRLAPIVAESARLLRATLPARITLAVECAAEIPLVLADETQIEQVLLNLATNAMHAMHGGSGRVCIRLDTLTLDAAMAEAQPALLTLSTGSVVRLAVIDDGSGMDEATIARIFDPFFTTKPVNEGTGLGLSVVQGIVAAHRGVITVNSQPGSGSSFTVYLPVAKEQSVVTPSAANKAAAAATRDTGQRILYIDDDEALVFLVKRLLTRRGYRISAHTDQNEALAALRADPAGFDLVVTDFNMPGMSGLDVARQVRAIRADLMVAVASGFIDDTLREQAIEAGAREFILKAEAVEDLCEVFARLANLARKE
jgi:PAS domain S-box-containing protein